MLHCLRPLNIGKLNRLDRIILVSVLVCFFILGTVPVGAEDISRPEELVIKSDMTFSHFVSDSNMTWFHDHVKDAKGLLIIPQLLKGGFILGGSGGSGLLLARDSKTGAWSYPAFYTMGAASIGFLVGAQSSEVILMVMTEKGLDSLLATSAKLGGDLSVAAGPVGVGTSAATADILAFARTKGAYAGVSLEGSVIKPRDGWNESYYGKPVRSVDILIRKTAKNADADKLRQTVTQATNK